MRGEDEWEGGGNMVRGEPCSSCDLQAMEKKLRRCGYKCWDVICFCGESRVINVLSPRLDNRQSQTFKEKMSATSKMSFLEICIQISASMCDSLCAFIYGWAFRAYHRVVLLLSTRVWFWSSIGERKWSFNSSSLMKWNCSFCQSFVLRMKQILPQNCHKISSLVSTFKDISPQWNKQSQECAMLCSICPRNLDSELFLEFQVRKWQMKHPRPTSLMSRTGDRVHHPAWQSVDCK